MGSDFENTSQSRRFLQQVCEIN